MNIIARTRTVMAAAAFTIAAATGAFAQDKIALPNEGIIPASEVPADATIVEIDKLKYVTPELTVATGTTVYWVNKEVMPHNVAFKKETVGADAFRGTMMKKDEAFAITFSEAGEFDYFCTPHPFMRGKVTVE